MEVRKPFEIRGSRFANLETNLQIADRINKLAVRSARNSRLLLGAPIYRVRTIPPVYTGIQARVVARQFASCWKGVIIIYI